MNAPQLFPGLGAKGPTRARPRSDTWFTPRPMLAALGGPESFDLDPCTDEARPWPTARQHYTAAENGLRLPWFGRVWLNPPYSRHLVGRFLARMAGHGCGVALVFARTDTKAFSRFIWDEASAVLFIAGRVPFCDATGEPGPANGGAPSVLCAYGREDAEVLAFSGVAGQFVPLQLPRLIAVGAVDQTWMQAVGEWFEAQEGPVYLADLYRAFAQRPKARRNPNYQAKLRQVLQHGPFRREARGLWSKAA